MTRGAKEESATGDATFLLGVLRKPGRAPCDALPESIILCVGKKRSKDISVNCQRAVQVLISPQAVWYVAAVAYATPSLGHP